MNWNPSKHWFLVAWCILPLACAVFLAMPSVTLPADAPGLRRFQTPAIGTNLRLSQTFTMTADGLNAVELSPARVGDKVSGSVRFEIYDITHGQQSAPLLRAVGRSAADLAKADTYRVQFLPIPHSKGRMYRLDIISSEPEGAGVAFRASKGEGYEGGAMLANGEARWADLTFRADAPLPSTWRLFMTLQQTSSVRAAAMLIAFVAIWLLVGVLVRALAVMPDAGPARDAHPSME